MAWKKASAEKIELLQNAVAPFACLYRKMFGYPTYFVNGNMFAGMHEDNIILRLSEGARETLLTSFSDAAPFEPMPGRPMKEYLVLPDSLYLDARTFDEWLDRSFRYASSLPPKEAASKRKR